MIRVGKIDAAQSRSLILVNAGNVIEVQADLHIRIARRKKVRAALLNVMQICKPRLGDLRVDFKVKNFFFGHTVGRQKIFHGVEVGDTVHVAAYQPDKIIISPRVPADSRKQLDRDFRVANLENFLVGVVLYYHDQVDFIEVQILNRALQKFLVQNDKHNVFFLQINTSKNLFRQLVEQFQTCAVDENYFRNLNVDVLFA